MPPHQMMQQQFRGPPQHMQNQGMKQPPTGKNQNKMKYAMVLLTTSKIMDVS